MLKTIGFVLVGLLAGQARAASVCPQAPSQFGNGNMLGCWTLNGVSSNLFEDSSANEHHAVASGAYSVIGGLDGGAVSIAGDGFLDLSILRLELDTSAWSISFWFRSNSPDSQMVFQQTTNEYLQGIVIVGGRPGYLVQNRADTTLFLGSASSLGDGAWHHVVFTRSNSGNRQFYVDGASVSTTRNTVAGWILPDMFLDTTSLGSPSNSLFPINGDLDDLLLVSRHLSDTNVLWIYNGNINTPPVYSSSPSLTTQEGALYTYAVAVWDPDADQTVTLALQQGPTGMSLNDFLLTWTPGNAQVGDHVVQLRAEDGVSEPMLQQFTLTVTNVNDVPQITSAPATEATEDELYTYQLEVFDPDPGDIITFRLGNAPSGMQIDSTGIITWLPGDAHVGSNNVTVLVSDGSGTNVSQDYLVTVTNVNDAPVIISTPVTAATEGQLYSYQISVSDPDSGETFTYHIISAPTGLQVSASGLAEWTPGTSQIGSNSITLQVKDKAGAEGIQNFSVTVVNVNDIPQITSQPPTTATEDVIYRYRVVVFNPDPEETITYRLAQKPSGMTVSPNGYISWTPNDNHIGINEVILLVSDGSGISVSQEFTVTVANVNDQPQILSHAPTVATENRLYTYNLSVWDPDPGEVLTYILESGPSGMTLSASGVLQWTPSQNDEGEHTITIIVRDKALAEDTQSFVLNVGTVNDPPAITTAFLPQGTEDEPYAFQLTGTDPEGSPLLWALLQGPEGMTLTAKGLLKYTPPQNANGEFGLLVLASDGVQNVIKDYSLHFAPVNDPPQIDSIVPKSQVYQVGHLVSFLLAATDPEGQELTWDLLNPPGVAYISPNNDFVWTPSIDQLGLDTIVFMVSDGELSDTLQHFTLVLDNLVDVQLSNADRPEFHVNGGELVINLPLQDAPAVFQVFDPLGRSLFYQTLNTPGSYNLPLIRPSSKSWCLLIIKTPRHRFIQKIRI